MQKSIYQRLFEGWPEPRMLLGRQPDGSWAIIKANELACRYFGYPDEDLEGRSFQGFLEPANNVHAMKAFDICCNACMPITVQLIPSIPGGISIRSFFVNPLMEDGKVTAIDMGARLPAQNEETLRRERDDAMSIFASIFDASDVGIVVTDHNRRIVRVNDTLCKNYGWDQMDLVGEEFTVMIPADEHGIARRRHDDFIGGLKVERSRELKILKKDGAFANVIASSGVIELSGQRKFRISTLVDITHLKSVERDLRYAKELADAASHSKSTFLANMSHELRTPLNAIIGFSDLMLAGMLGDIGNPHYREYLGDIRFSATHLLDIINDVLDMSKIEAGQMDLDLQRTDIGTLLEESVRLIRARATSSGLTLEMTVEKDLPPVMIDQRMLRQVLLNLLSNAVKFSHGGTCIRLSAARIDAGFIEIKVSDSGIGIPENKMGEVMEPFGQVHDPRINGGQGTGLGLPLARTMVELHGGAFKITSKMDVGTTVAFTLPIK